VRPGAIEIDRVTRRFRVHPKPTRTLKELFLARGGEPPTDVWALREVSATVEPGEAVGLIGRNGSGKTTLLRIVSGIVKPTAGRVQVGGRIGSLLELGAGFHPEFTGHENVYLNGSILGLKRRQIDEHFDQIVAFAELESFIDLPVRTYSSGMQMRLGFAVAAHVEADVLLLDEVFAVGDEEFQRKCFGKIHEFKQRGGTIVFVSHDAHAVERVCERAILLREGRVEFDGATADALAAYHRQLADERDPAERGAGLSEWGSGEARIVSARLEGPEGEPRAQYLAGEPLAVELRVRAAADLAPPRLQYELRDDAGQLLAGGAQDAGELGWDGAAEQAFRLEVPELPLADGRFHLRFGLVDARGERLYHWLDDAVSFVVYPAEDVRGPVRLEARWSRSAAGGALEETLTESTMGSR
jgi:ABC-type polysaccharide/polyol phosphate transport system ATPase subunit